ncbi:MAG TPA: ABC transporter substrate-binding protein [Gammaproteobacteria bacterium]|nr:ABC transporter substrate-binding protein [Gammaproteobacteria bacterium]
MHRTLSVLGLGSFMLLGLLAFSGTASAAGPTCPNGSINVGSVSTMTGPVDFSNAPQAAKAVFKQLNANGGIDGCKINYIIEDDKGDPQIAAQAARDLILNKHVVAMDGAASLIDCEVNARLYQREGVMAVQGVGVDPACFNSPSVAPVNVGPYTATTAIAYYATKDLKVKNLCADFTIIGGTEKAYRRAIQRWEKLTGDKIRHLDMTVPVQGDLTPYLTKAREEGCDAVIYNGVAPQVVQWVKTAEAQHIHGIDWLFLAPAYSNHVAQALGDTGQPIYVATEWEPYTQKGSPANQGWIRSMKAAHRPLTAFSQGGYLAAHVLIDVIKHINGPVTHQSVTHALRNMKPIPTPLSGSPYVFGKGRRHAPMQATKIVTLRQGQWKVLTSNWVRLPKRK